MGVLMQENERRLKEIVNLSEERVAVMVTKKADRQVMEEKLKDLVSRNDLTESLRKLRQMHRALEPIYTQEALLQRLKERLEIMTTYSDEEIALFEAAKEKGEASVQGETKEDGVLRQLVMDMRAQMSSMGNKVKLLYND